MQIQDAGCFLIIVHESGQKAKTWKDVQQKNSYSEQKIKTPSPSTNRLRSHLICERFLQKNMACFKPSSP